MFIISLHKKQKWLSYGAYVPLRQPRLSPLCGCECELIKNVCFSTFLVAVEGEGSYADIFYKDDIEYEVNLLIEKADEVEKYLKEKLSIKQEKSLLALFFYNKRFI